MPADLKTILKIEVPLIVQIGSREMPAQEVMSLAPGAIVELAKLADEALEILVNNKLIGFGRAVKVGENFGIRVCSIGDARHRIAALAPSGAAADESDGAVSNAAAGTGAE